MEVYNLFDYRALYTLIVDFFEAPSDRVSKQRSNELLKWWTAYVSIPHHTDLIAIY